MTGSIFRRTLKQTTHFLNLNSTRSLATVFDGNALASEIRSNIKNEIGKIKSSKPSFSPKLIAIAVGDHTSSNIYLSKKMEAAKESSLTCDIINVPSETSESNLIEMINDLNQDRLVNGIIVQLPLPSHMSEIKICNTVDPSKDVDGFTQINLGRTMQNIGQSTLVPCTVLAVKKIVESFKLLTHGANSVVIGRSHNVGMPIAVMLGSDALKGGFNMTSTLCHRYTPFPTLTAACLNADLIVSAAGVPGIVKAGMVKDGAAVVDVGLSRIKNDKGRNVVVGDVEKDVRRVAEVLTPVPGGVGPVTVACLMYNTFLAAKIQHGIIKT